MIGVVRKNFQEAVVDDHLLDNLIVSNKIIAFRRTIEWVVIGRDPVRNQRTFYPGEERRKAIYGTDFCMR